MELSEGIRRLGFRRWYERQLIESHLFFVTAFLSMILVVACLEEFSLRAPGWTPIIKLALIVGGSALCIWSFGRYKAMLDFAEHAAERSTCSNCMTYGVLEVLPPVAAGGEAAVVPAAPGLHVRCRKCGYTWHIE